MEAGKESPQTRKTDGGRSNQDTGDIDGDGDLDFALGSHPLGLTPGRMRGTWAHNGLMGAYLLNLRK